MKKIQIIACLLALQAIQMQATVVVHGNDTNAPFGFKTPVISKVFDRTNGTFYAGLEGGTTITVDTRSQEYAISCATRPTFFTTPQFIGIAKDDTLLKNKSIEFLALAEQTNAAPILAIVTKTLIGTSFRQKFVIGLPTNGDTPSKTGELNDAQGIDTARTHGIVNIAATPTHIFAAVRPNGGGNFGDVNGGISLISVTKTNDSVVLEAKDATTGLGGSGIPNKAQPLDNDTLQVKGISGGQAVTFSADPADINKVAMHYDSFFDRLYIGLRIATGNVLDDIGKAVVAARIDKTANNSLILEEIVADGAIPNGNAANKIIVGKTSATPTAKELRVKHIRTLHTSTGASYLIINGGQGTTAQIGNKIQALPLVNNPSTPTRHGTLASIQADLNTPAYATPATNPAHLFDNNNPEALVGNGNLPMADADDISDIVVVGDTVYVSIAKAVSPTNDSGIFYSQALFNSNGKILRWTPWTKRAVPFNAFEGIALSGDVPHTGSINFFDVDAKTGNVWIVEGTTGRTIGITSWTRHSSATSLITQLNKALPCGSFSVLDLDQATHGFVGQTTNRYALFGGNNAVVFARTTQATGNNINSPQTVISDFSSAENFIETELPENAGCINVLEYGRRPTGSNTNYFFAGAQTGLFAFAGANGAGFDVNTLGTLNDTPFAGNVWQKIASIAGTVVDIKTSGNKLYVLTTEVTTDKKNPIKSKLLSFAFANTLAGMFANPTVLAQTGIGPSFSTVSAFFGIQIIATDNPQGGNPEDKEQLILATNNGLFSSNADQTGGADGIIDANNQGDARWFAIQSNEMFPGIAGIDTPVHFTVWPLSVQDMRGFGSFARGSIAQVSGTGNAGGTAAVIGTFVPSQFNANDTSNYFATLDPIIYFWSDGGRRLFIVQPITDPSYQNKVSSIPFDVITWNISANTLLRHPVLQTIQRFFWIKQIGATGLLLAGTEKGIVGLE